MTFSHPSRPQRPSSSGPEFFVLGRADKVQVVRDSIHTLQKTSLDTQGYFHRRYITANRSRPPCGSPDADSACPPFRPICYPLRRDEACDGPTLTHLSDALTMPSLNPPCGGSSLARPCLLLNLIQSTDRAFWPVRPLPFKLLSCGQYPLLRHGIVALRVMPELNDWP